MQSNHATFHLIYICRIIVCNITFQQFQRTSYSPTCSPQRRKIASGDRLHSKSSPSPSRPSSPACSPQGRKIAPGDHLYNKSSPASTHPSSPCRGVPSSTAAHRKRTLSSSSSPPTNSTAPPPPPPPHGVSTLGNCKMKTTSHPCIKSNENENTSHHPCNRAKEDDLSKPKVRISNYSSKCDKEKKVVKSNVTKVNPTEKISTNKSQNVTGNTHRKLKVNGNESFTINSLVKQGKRALGIQRP